MEKICDDSGEDPTCSRFQPFFLVLIVSINLSTMEIFSLVTGKEVYFCCCCRSVYGNSISDHLEYYGFELWADADSTCKIVVIEVIEEYNIGTGG